MISRVKLPLAITIGVVAALVTVAGCPRPAPEPIRIGINSWPGYELLHLASRLGYYEQEGVQVRVLEFTSLADCRRALERGQVDGSGTTIVELVETQDNGRNDLRVVYALDFSNGGDVVLGRPSITSIEQLKGASVAVEHDSVGVYVLGRALESVGLKLGDVKVVSMDQLSGEEAFLKGEVDAYVSYPPCSTAILNSKKANRLFDTSAIPRDVLDVLVVDERTLTTRTDEIRRLLRAYDRAVAFVEQHPDEAFAMMAEREQVKVVDFRRSFEQDIRILNRADQQEILARGGTAEKSLKGTAEYLFQAGQTSRLVPVDKLLLSHELRRKLELPGD